MINDFKSEAFQFVYFHDYCITDFHIVLSLLPSFLVFEIITSIKFLVHQLHILFASMLIVTGLFNRILYSSA